MTVAARVLEIEDTVKGVLAGTSGLAIHLQPIVDLKRGLIPGYEALSRFDGHRPDLVFRAADELGLGVELQLHAARAALDLRPSLPPHTFLSINVGADVLDSPGLVDLLRRAAPLHGLVVEITEHERIDVERLAGTLDLVRELGGLVAVDDVGAGYAGLQAVLGLRPDLLKVDRSLVADMDRDPIKQETVRMLGELAGRLDAWLLVEGVETFDELRHASRLRVPLAQGFALGRPAADIQTLLAPEVADHLRQLASDQTLSGATGTVGALVEPCRVIDTRDVPTLDRGTSVRVDPRGRVLELVPPRGAGATDDRPLVVQRDEAVVAVAARVAAEAGRLRFGVVVVETDGRVAGVVLVRHLLGVLASGQAPPAA